MPVVSMKQLLEAGVHFGHQTRRWNPKMSRYIFTERNGIHIIDLQKTVNGLENAFEFVRELSSTGEKVLFVGTKKQAQEAVRDEAMRAGQFYVNQRWLGGLLTNFKTIQERLRRLDELERMKQTGEMDLRPKKEQLKLGDEMAKLNRLLGGIRTMRRLPAALVIVDCQKEHLAVHEASRLNIPMVALVDTNADPDPISYPIPANDDAIRAVRLLAGRIADAVIEGQQMRESMMADAETEESGPTDLDPQSGAAPVDVEEPERTIASDQVSTTETVETARIPETDSSRLTSSEEEVLADIGGSLTASGAWIEAEAGVVTDNSAASESGQGAETMAIEADSADAEPAAAGSTDLTDDESVIPMTAVDGLEPLPDTEADTSVTDLEGQEAVEVGE